VCVGPYGQPQFYDLMFRRAQPVFYAFDLLWLDADDLRELPLLERKRRLRRVVPRRGLRLLYLDHVGRRGSDLFDVVCDRDLEGIVGKRIASEGRHDVCSGRCASSMMIHWGRPVAPRSSRSRGSPVVAFAIDDTKLVRGVVQPLEKGARHRRLAAT
jgi:hypothetical protein